MQQFNDQSIMYDILSQLEYELSDKRGIFGKKVDLDKCWQLVVQLKQSMPECLHQARSIIEQRSELLKNADNIAQNMINDAEHRIASMVDSAQLKRRAEFESQKIISDAYAKCDSMINTTRQHIDSIFVNTEEYLQSLATNLQANRNELNKNT